MEDLIQASELLISYLCGLWGPKEKWSEDQRFVVNQLRLEINEARPGVVTKPGKGEICSDYACDYCAKQKNCKYDGAPFRTCFDGRKLSPIA